ncbi:MAG: hypothetical protein GY870_06555 [archaeon]|nr:hypothetical protein [archaeon]
MGKEINFELEFIENGKKGKIDIPISFISRGVIKDYEKIRDEKDKLRNKLLEVEECNYLIVDYKKEKPENWKKGIKELNVKVDDIMKEIRSFNFNSLIDEEMKIIYMILKDNLIDNEKLFDRNFWDYCVDPPVILDFVQEAVYKDIDLKKKQPIKE